MCNEQDIVEMARPYGTRYVYTIAIPENSITIHRIKNVFPKLGVTYSVSNVLY